MKTVAKTLAVIGLGLGVLGLGPALAAGGIYDYAVAHPVPDASLTAMPSIGDSVPADVRLEVPEDGGPYGYFYLGGRPVIVDLATRAVVRIGQ